ncbi:putative T7SS-secreted protein [Streptomyces sp. NPDC050803]|uniref:putative T7SS-secreted protein n=1 Tax=unclassified Streptomyces TaxID=2593676 RepID=UPI00341B4B85
MTLTPGIEQSGAALDPRSRADRDKPQGLKSAPAIPNPDYTHLGFNPVPGSTETIRELHRKLASCAKVLEDAHGLVTKLLDGSYWKGDAAVAFREQLDGGPLPRNLKNAARSLRKAVTQLSRWETELDDFQRRAKRLEDDAKDARSALDRAKERANKSDHNTDVEDAQSDLDKILNRARKLAQEHESQANHRATKIREATNKLAPHEPGLFDEALDWLGENLGDVLSFAAGIAAAVAIIFAGPLGAVMVAALMLVAAALSGSALAWRMSDDETWESLMDGFFHGEFDADFFSNLVSVGADAMGMLPGVGAVALGTKGLVNAIRTGGGSLTLGQKLGALGTETVEGMQGISRVNNPLVGLTVRGVSAARREAAGKTVAATSSLVGVGTGGFGLYNSLADADDDGIKDGSVAGIDGTRLVLDNGGVFNLVSHVF